MTFEREHTMISLTKTAAEQIRQAAQNSEAGRLGLRVAARVNDAGMLEFGMGFDEERSNDAITESWGITLLVNAQSAPLLQDVTIDFTEVSPGQPSFVFLMPGTEGGGCGSTGGEGGGCGKNGCGSGGCGSHGHDHDHDENQAG